MQKDATRGLMTMAALTLLEDIANGRIRRYLETMLFLWPMTTTGSSAVSDIREGHGEESHNACALIQCSPHGALQALADCALEVAGRQVPLRGKVRWAVRQASRVPHRGRSGGPMIEIKEISLKPNKICGRDAYLVAYSIASLHVKLCLVCYETAIAKSLL